MTSDQSVLQLDKLFGPDLGRVVESVGTVRSMPAGEVILQVDSYIRSIPIVLQGSLKIFREDEEGNELFLYYVNEQESCALSFVCCLMQEKSKVKAVADEDTTLLLIPVEYMERWMNDFPKWKNFVLQTYRQRFEELLKTIDSIAFQKMDERLQQYLKEKAHALQSNEIIITHQQIANELHTSREVISRLLKQMEKQNLVSLSRNKITLLSAV